MRCVTRICLAVFGLALAVPSAAWADPPDSCRSCEWHSRWHRDRSPRICENCIRSMQQANGGVLPPAVMAGAPVCSSCQAQLAAGAVPGYTVMGGALAMSAPAPIGVVQASYNVGAQASNAPGHASVGPAGPSAMPLSPPNVVGPQGGHRRPHIVGHLLGLRSPGALIEEHKDRERMSHAAIAYGEHGQPVSELPARMVYSR